MKINEKLTNYILKIENKEEQLKTAEVFCISLAIDPNWLDVPPEPPQIPY